MLIERLNIVNIMPIYEFYSPDSRKIYSFFARSLSCAEKVPFCPDGKKYRMRKVISGFSITGKREEPEELPQVPNDPDDPFSGMDESKAQAAMQELEGAIEGMDEENPDPRQMGQLMRRMCDLTGESMDDPMEEVVRKLEEGMDPDELEDRMGDAFGDDAAENGMPGASPDAGDGDESGAKSKLRRLMRRPLVRDPELYEFTDYLDK
jgi:hypothetical protein|tara:strand:- start:1134 stop:1754 length:621 start_codon:yes stop_codon:yes gene_type:complete